MKQKFYICRHCGNLVGMVHDSGVPIVCCGEKMQPLVPNTVEASGEKHLPAVTMEDGVLHVRVGSVEHPMLPDQRFHGFQHGTSRKSAEGARAGRTVRRPASVVSIRCAATRCR